VTGWLIDTNVLSAFGPDRPALRSETISWLRERADALFLSTITAAEIEAGIAKLHRTGGTRRVEALRGWLDRILEQYAERLLPFDLAAARMAGRFIDAAQALGRYPGFADISIAAIAASQQLVLLTVNLRHFEPLGIEMLNPLDLA
jgi:predicted nucleic acid-binding protein